MAAGDIFKNLKNQCSNLLRDIKKGIKEEGPKKAKEEALKRAPTPEQIINEFEALAKENPKKAEQYYTKTKNKLEAVKLKLENSRKKIETLQFKLENIDNKISNINDVAETINKFVKPIQAAIAVAEIATAPVGPAAIPGAAGTVVTTSELKIKLKGFGKYIISIIADAIGIVATINKTSKGVRIIIPSAISKIEEVEAFIQKILDLLEQLYINMLLPLLDGYDEIDGGIESVEDLYNQYPELETYLTSEGDITLPNNELPYGVTNGISNIPPKFFRRYRKGPYTDIY
tara:strand:+ start:1444 stop:2307 length:864 start_codon:yes stop_codon:yes gene_type:complete